jgi:hypothetical protein
MPLSNFRPFFDNKEEFEDFKAKNQDFVERMEAMASSIESHGFIRDFANKVVFEKMYQQFLRAKNHYDINKD